MAVLAAGTAVVLKPTGLIANAAPLRGTVADDGKSVVWNNGNSFDATTIGLNSVVRARVDPSDFAAILGAFLGKAVRFKVISTMEMVGIVSDGYWAEDIGTTDSSFVIVLALMGPNADGRYAALEIGFSEFSGGPALAIVQNFCIAVADESPRYK